MADFFDYLQPTLINTVNHRTVERFLKDVFVPRKYSISSHRQFIVSIMYKKLFLFLASIFICFSNFGQEKIAKEIYLYGVFENFNNGKTLVSYIKSDKRTSIIHYNQKLEYEMVELFKKKGVNAISYGNIFGLFQRKSGDYLFTKESTAELMNQNQIETLIKITLNNWPLNIVSKSNSSFNDLDNSIVSKPTSENISGKVRLLIEIYTSSDSFSKPLSIISVNTNKNWVLDKSYYDFTISKLTRVLKLIENKKE